MTLAGLTVAELLDAVAERTSAPGGGAAAGVAAALAAALTAMSARFAGGELPALAERADELRRAAVDLADADVAAYAAYLAARRSEASLETAGLLDAATDVPLRLIAVGEEVVRLGLRVATEGNPRLRGDSAASVLLAAAAVRAGAVLVCENVRDPDPRIDRARSAVAVVHESEQALLALYPGLGPTISS